jgi:hypothetical protein
MEIILAIAVATAVIFFGALISAGNERQQRAIDGLREQVVLWAMQDLRIKREKLARDVCVDDPLSWFNEIATKISGTNFCLRLLETSGELGVLVFSSEDGIGRVVFTNTSPEEIRRMKREKNGRLSKYANDNPLVSLLAHATAYEISVLNGGVFFDLELPKAWKALTGMTFGNTERIWMYVKREA